MDVLEQINKLCRENGYIAHVIVDDHPEEARRVDDALSGICSWRHSTAWDDDAANLA